MKIKTVIAAASVSGLAIAGLASITPAEAQLTTSCVGTAGAVTVPGDLVVPKGKSCNLDGTTVEGKVRVSSGADLVAANATFNDTVSVAADGFFDAYKTKVASNVSASGSYGVYLDESNLGGSYVGKAGETTPFVFFGDSTVAKSINTNSGEVLVESSKVGGAVTATGAKYLDVVDSTLSRTLTVSGNTDGSLVCGSEVDGAASFTGNKGVQLGTGTALGVCDDVNVFGSDVTASNNTGNTIVAGNIIRGNLAGEGNAPAPTGADNRVRGQATGQFADLKPAGATAQRRSAPVDKTAATKAKGEQRRVAAKEKAVQAGPAQIG